MSPLHLYARVRFLRTFAHETAGAACTRHSLLPLLGEKVLKNFGRIAPRECKFTYDAQCRHCERGETIYLSSRQTSLDRFVADAPNNDGATCPELTFGVL